MVPTLKVDRAKALKILEEQVSLVGFVQHSDDWESIVTNLVTEITATKTNRTFIAALGTALLAKATNPEIDPFALKAGLDTRGAYSARTLCQHVLAAHSLRLGIDIGVTGREPLNNQPFFAESRISNKLPVKPAARNALSILLNALEKINQIDTQEGAESALRAFLKCRISQQKNYGPLDKNRKMDLKALVKLIKNLVNSDGEYGKRAQAVAAGLMDTAFDSENIRVGKIHDPDARFPGDIGVVTTHQGDEEQLFIALEVRDKPVSGPDIYHFVNKAIQNQVYRAGVLCAGYKPPSGLSEATQWSFERKVTLKYFPDWPEFISQVIFWSSKDLSEPFELAYRNIFERLKELEVSDEGIKIWMS